MRRFIVTAAVLLGVVAAGAVIVVSTGLVPAKASSRHWAITNAILHFAMQRSVATHAPDGPLPGLDDPALVARGAGHYHSACLPCHGSPERGYFPRVAFGMTPPPPFLPDQIDHWEPEELFFIVKHGVKFTGMPAWPSQARDDEVRAMVAFLRVLPELDAERYRALAHGEVAGEVASAASLDSFGATPTKRALVLSCARCHGEDGQGRGGASPRLAGQQPEYMLNALEAYARGGRHSGIMQPVANGLGEEARRYLAEHYGAMSGGGARDERRLRGGGAEPEAIARGERIALRGVPEKGVPSCADCHGPDRPPRNPAYPLLAGQYADYLVAQLELFKKKTRGGSPFAHLMEPVAERLTPEEMRDVAAFYASLPAPESLRVP